MSGIIIIGSGHGGVQAAASLREEGYAGAITLIGSDPELPYHKPPLSKAYLKSEDAQLQLLRGEAFYADNAITLKTGQTVDAIDGAAKTVRLADGSSLGFEALILATGARPRMLTCPGHELAGIHTLREAHDAAALRHEMGPAQDIVVIGGGFIGLEAAATFAAAGKRVTVVEMAHRVLGRAVSAEVSRHMAGYLEGLGITIMTQTGITELTGSAGRVTGAVLSTGAAIKADMVIVGIGAMPETALAEAAGIACENGIKVDAGMRTSLPDIYAIGDCVSFPHKASGRRLRLESVQNATDQARHAAKVITGKDGDYDTVAWFWSDQGERKLQMAGLSFDADRFLVTGDPSAGSFSVWHFAGPKLIAVDSVNKPADHMMSRRILAAGFTPTDADIQAGAPGLKAALAAFEAG
ncbi:MAG: NAD(P)/FAD-dependent oxidoreductase [Notoacmeibacter sp.]|nr:NAD(P)/FAD-dependent oxidoreductase [Notoacmeibacter sp.]